MIQIDIDTVAENVTPPRLRSEEWLAVIESLNEPLRTQLEVFYKFVKAKRYELAFNGQVIYLEHLLNDKFNPAGTPKIYIEDMTISEPFYLYNELYNADPVYLFNKDEPDPAPPEEPIEPVYLFNQAEYAVGFIIYVPTGVVTNWNEFHYWVDKYKLKSKEYTIIEY